MSTREQEENVRGQVAELAKHHFRGFTEWKGDRLLIERYREIDWDDGKEGTSLRGWLELDDRELRHVMERYVQWDGFEDAEKQAFIGGVIDEINDRQYGEWRQSTYEHQLGEAGRFQGEIMLTHDEAENVTEQQSLAAEIRADEQVARVRDYGEADAATYEQRVREGAASLIDPATYQVWHHEGDRYKQVATVESQELLGGLMRTNHGFMKEDWREIDGVTPTPGEHRSTTFGDIIIDPDGQEYRFSEIKTDFGPAPGFEPTTAIRDQQYGEWREATYEQQLDELSHRQPANDNELEM